MKNFKIRNFTKNTAVIPLAIILAGSLFAWFHIFSTEASSPLSALFITLLTSCLACLSVIALPQAQREEQKDNNNIDANAEELEDKAWELRESDERYRTLAEAFGDMLVVRKNDGMITYCNPAFAERFDFTTKQLIGSNFDQFDANSKYVSPPVLNKTREIAFKTPFGKRWYTWIDMPTRDDEGEGTLILSVARDITRFKKTEQIELRAREKAEQASSAKSKFLATVSHEMRTPLNGILGMSKLIAGTKLSAEQENYNQAVSQSGEALLSLIEDILDITMIEAGRFELHKSTFDLRLMLHEIIELLSSRAYEKNIDLGLYVDPAIPAQIISDKNRCRQILINLVGNAIKFTAKGGVALKCYLHSFEDERKCEIRFEIEDTGPGLKKSEREKIFEEFERVSDNDAHKIGGAGLGLTISRAIVNEMEGDLTLLSTSKKGSVFALDLPMQIKHKQQQDNLDKSQSLGGRNILFISKSSKETECIAEQIRAFSGNVNQVEKLETALHHLQTENYQPDVILVEPGDNKSLNKMIEKLKSSAGHARLVVMLEPAKRSQFLHHLELGATSWLIRPVREDSLIDVVIGRVGQAPTTQNKLNTNGYMAPQHPISVLLAEDNDINALLVSSALKKAGVKVARAHDGKQALELFNDQKHEFNMILMDMHMPVMDGLEAVSKIRTTEKSNSLSPTTIYALTADQQAATRRAASKAGVDGFLDKPLNPNELVSIVLAQSEQNLSDSSVA